MANIVTITNNYDNGVCDGFRIYTGTTFNGDPYIIPNTATLISPNLISLPYDLNMGDYEGPLYVFLEHCDNYTTPPPGGNPKRQGGFQVNFVFIECPCPVESVDCRMGATFIEFIDTDCNIDASFVEYVEPTPTPTATIGVDCNIDASFEEYIEPTPTPLPTSTSTPVPTSTSTPTPTPTVDCDWEATFVEDLNPPV